MTRTKPKDKTVRLTGLMGTKKDVCAYWVWSVSAAMKRLRDDKAISTFDVHGAISVWRDDDGYLRCEYMRRRQTICAQRFVSLAAVHEWLRKWFPAMSELAIEPGALLKAAASLADKLCKIFVPGAVSVAVGDDVLIVYEHERGISKRIVDFGDEHEGFKIIRKYFGRVKI